MTFDQVLYDVSFANVVLYGSALPSYDDEKEEDIKGEEIINADDPANREKVREALFG